MTQIIHQAKDLLKPLSLSSLTKHQGEGAMSRGSNPLNCSKERKNEHSNLPACSSKHLGESPSKACVNVVFYENLKFDGFMILVE